MKLHILPYFWGGTLSSQDSFRLKRRWAEVSTVARYKACVHPQRAFLALVQAVKKTAAFLGVLSPGQSQR